MIIALIGVLPGQLVDPADFAGYTPVPWREQGVPATLEELNEETIAFDGVAVITEGVVLVATGF